MSRNDLPSPGSPNFGQRMREAVMTYLGRQGDPLDRGITLRDLIDAGVVRFRQGFSAGGATGGGALPIEPEVQEEAPDLTPPPTPTGFQVSAAISHVFIEHDAPTYTQGHGHLRTRVYGKTVAQGDPLPTFAQAAEITQFSGKVHSHPTNPSTTWRLWIKWESQDGVLSVDPAGGTNGLAATTGQDVSTLLQALTGEITESQLYQALGDRINLIDGSAAVSGSVNARIAVVNDIAVLKNRTYVSASAPTQPAFTLVAGDLWIDSDDNNKLYRWSGSAWVAVTDTRIGALVTDFQSETTSRIEGDLAETRRREALYAASFAGAGNNYRYFVQATQPTGTQIGDIWSWVDPSSGAVTFRRFNGATWVDSAADTRAAVYKGASSSPPSASLVIGDLYFDTDDKKVYVYNGSTWVERQASMPEVAAFVYSEQIARVDGDGALAQQISTVSATKTRSYWQTSAPTGTVQVPLVEGDLWFDTDDANRVYRWSGSQWQSGRDGAIAIVDARVDTVETAKIGYCVIGGAASDHTTRQACEAAGGTWNVGLPVATAVKQVAISDGATTAALEQRFTAQKSTNDGLLAQYTVKVDIGGHVSGFGLASTANNATPQSDFGVRADKFWVAPPSTSSATAPTTGLYKGYAWRDTSASPSVTRYWTGAAWSTTPQTLPFVIVTSSGTINGVTVGPGVYIDTALIANATITTALIANAAIDTARIADAAITNAKVANLDATKITTGFLNAERIAADSITAAKIDSRNLTIKDASGNVIFSAGTNLDWSRISSQPSGIFNSNITINGSGQITGIGTGANTAVANSQISINANGTLSGAGGGQVTPSGLGAVAVNMSNAPLQLLNGYNYDFESGAATGWTNIGSVVDDAGASFGKAGQVSANSTRTYPALVDIDPRRAYAVRMRVKASSAGTITGGVLCFNAAGAEITGTGALARVEAIASGASIPTGDWRTFEAVVSGEQALSGADTNTFWAGTVKAAPFLSVSGGGTLQVDFVELTDITEAWAQAPKVVSHGLTMGYGAGYAVKLSNTAAYDSGVRSRNAFVGGAYLAFSPARGDRRLAIGLNTDPATDAGLASIDYALVCYETGVLYASESGGALANLGAYSANDLLAITCDGLNVRYYRNGVVLRTVSASPTAALYLDSAFWSFEAAVYNLEFVALGVSGLGSFASLSQITNGNISTYIGPAAITDAYIGNLNAAKINAGTLSADRIAAESITAAKIDSRGLSIKDASGNIILAAGTPLASANLAAGAGVNVIPNADFIDGAGTLAAGSFTTATAPTIDVNFSADYRVQGESTAWAAVAGTPAAGLQFNVEVRNGPNSQFSCTAGERYEFSAYLKTLNATASFGVAWYNSAGAFLSEVFTGSVNSVGTFTSLAGMVRASAFAVAPAGAVRATLFVRVVCGGGATPGAFFSRLYFGTAGPAQNEPSPWAPGRGVGRITPSNASTYIADLAVDTLQIAGSAITVPIIAEYAPQQSIPQNTWTQLLTVSPNFGAVTPRGALVSAQAVIYITSGAQNSWSFRIKRGATQIKTYDFTVANNVSPIAIPIQFIDETPGTGTVTYTFEVWHDTNATGGVQNVSLVVYGGKR